MQMFLAKTPKVGQRKTSVIHNKRHKLNGFPKRTILLLIYPRLYKKQKVGIMGKTKHILGIRVCKPSNVPE